MKLVVKKTRGTVVSAISYKKSDYSISCDVHIVNGVVKSITDGVIYDALDKMLATFSLQNNINISFIDEMTNQQIEIFQFVNDFVNEVKSQPDQLVILSNEDNEFTEEEKEAYELKLAKQRKVMEIDEYDTSSAVNGFYVNGMNVWIDRALRTTYLNNSIPAARAAGANKIGLWINDILIEINIDLAQKMLLAIEWYALQCFNVTANHKLQVNALTTIKAVNAFNIKKDYPEKLSFTI